MLERLDRDGGDIERDVLANIYQRQSKHARDFAANLELSIPMVPYKETIADPLAVAERVAKFLDADLDLKAMAHAVDPSLYRQRCNPSESG